MVDRQNRSLQAIPDWYIKSRPSKECELQLQLKFTHSTAEYSPAEYNWLDVIVS